MHRLFALVALAPLVLAPCRAQTPGPCDPPALRAIAPGKNIFDERQEQDLGDAIAEHLQRTFRVIDDESVNAYLEAVGNRVVAQLPKTSVQFRFALVDLPDDNAFSLPGGRIYVSRKMVAIAETEDELAGVVAHEAGHVVAKHGAIGMTRMMREVLDVTSVGDRKDVFEKYNRLVENVARNPKAAAAVDDHDDPDQVAADRLGLYAMVRAGYDPAAMSRFFDRVAETRGKTGNFFTDVFGTTSDDAKRLRTMRKSEQTLPAACVPERKAEATAEYRAWQSAVLGYAAHGGREALHGVRSKTVLEPPLRDEISTLRFSPDGKYLLAQDQSGVAVLSHDPFAFLFRIDAPDAEPAQFTPDSREIVFNTPGLRVERWDVAGRKLVSARELYRRASSVQTALSPDGRTLALLDGDLTLALLDVESGATVFEKKAFYVPNPFELLMLEILAEGEDSPDDLSVNFVNMAFSPDGSVFAAGARGIGAGLVGIVTELSAVAVDTRSRAPLALKGQSKKLLAGGFCFVGTDRIAAWLREDPKKSGLYTFPEGKLVEVQPFEGGTPSTVARGHYMLQRPAAQYAVGLLDLTTKSYFKANQQSAFDVFDEQFVSERKNGEIGLFGVAKNDVLATVALPKSPLGRLRAAALAPDMSWLAVSGRVRGAVWNLKTGERTMYVRSFRGAGFAPDGALYADFPKSGEDKRTIMRLDPRDKSATNVIALDEKGPHQYGTYVARLRPRAEDGDLSRDVQLEVRDARTDATLWTKPFAKEPPTVYARDVDGTVALAWSATSDFARDEIKASPKLAAAASRRAADSDRLVEVFDFATGKELGRALVDTGNGSFTVERAVASGDWLVVQDSTRRSLVYSLATGELKGRIFGGDAAVSAARGLVCVQNEPGQLVVYDLVSNERRDELRFSSPVVLIRWGADGKQLFALTASQEAYVLDVAP